jgi:hypothetical protein
MLSVTDGDQGVRVKKATTASRATQHLRRRHHRLRRAYFALSSVAACLDMPASIIALAGSIAAAGVAQRRGNERPVSEQEFLTIGKIVI